MTTVMLNNVHCKPKNLVNFMELIAKQYIFASKCLKKRPVFEEVMEKVTQLEKIEKYIALNEDQMAKHEQKWENFSP